MLLSDNYKFLKNYFENAINGKENKLIHSIVFWGSDFDVQYNFAKEIARLLNCQGTHSDDCNCLSCRWIEENTHPAFMTISKTDNKSEDDDSKTVISIKQASMIKEMLASSSDFHRVFVFCDRDDEGNISGLNRINFQDVAANSLLKTIEEPQDGVTFIFLTRYLEDILSTIISRSQCFFVPSYKKDDFNYDLIKGIFENYWEFNRADVFSVSERLQSAASEHGIKNILGNIQNYMLCVLHSNTKNERLIKHITYVEQAIEQANSGIKPVNVLDDLCLKLIK